MATSDDNVIKALFDNAVGPFSDATWSTPGDLARASFEAMLTSAEGDARALHSKGRLRLWGSGVDEHRADLESFGVIAATWQRAVNAVGASLEGVMTSQGRLPKSLLDRTALVVSASPGAGSVVLRVEAKSDALDEVEPTGDRPMHLPNSSDLSLEPTRPLVDRASDDLIDVLSSIREVAPHDFGTAEATLRRLGPRASAAIKSLTGTLASADMNLDADWEEPGEPTRKTRLTSDQARWISKFIEGRDLDSEISILEGEAITVSSRERWLVEVAGEDERIRVADLPAEVVSTVSPGDTVKLEIETHSRVQPDGAVRTTHIARRVIDIIKADGSPS